MNHLLLLHPLCVAANPVVENNWLETQYYDLISVFSSPGVLQEGHPPFVVSCDSSDLITVTHTALTASM